MATRDPYSRQDQPSTGAQSQGEMMDQARQRVEQAREQSRPMTEQVQQKAGETVNQAQERAKSMMAEQKERAAGSVESMAQALRQTGEQLRSQDQAATVAPYVDRVADQIEQVSNYLRTKDVNELIDDVERFARREPALFVGGAFALGLLAARFMKSSSPRSMQRRRYTSVQYQYSGYGSEGYRPGEGYRSGMEGARAEERYGPRPASRYATGMEGPMTPEPYTSRPGSAQDREEL